MSRSCARVTGYIETATLPSRLTRFTSSSGPRMPADKIDALACAWVVDTEQRRKNSLSCSALTSSHGTGSALASAVGEGGAFSTRPNVAFTLTSTRAVTEASSRYVKKIGPVFAANVEPRDTSCHKLFHKIKKPFSEENGFVKEIRYYRLNVTTVPSVSVTASCVVAPVMTAKPE